MDTAKHMTPGEAGARAIAEARNSGISTSGVKASRLWTPEDEQMARAAAIAMVGAMRPAQFLDVLIEGGKGTTESPFDADKASAELAKQLTK